MSGTSGRFSAVSEQVTNAAGKVLVETWYVLDGVTKQRYEVDDADDAADCAARFNRRGNVEIRPNNLLVEIARARR